MFLSPDLRDWIPGNHIVHFILDAVGHLPLGVYRLNWKGAGSKQTPVCIKESVTIGLFGPKINSLPALSGILKTQSPTDS
jgi:hypothetical protein